MKMKKTNPDDLRSLKNQVNIFNFLHYDKGILRGLIESKLIIQSGNMIMDHHLKTLDKIISKLYDLVQGTRSSEYKLSRNTQYLIDNYKDIEWGTWKVPDMSWECPCDGEIHACPTISKSCKPTIKELQNIKDSFVTLEESAMWKILRNWRIIKVCHTGITSQLENSLEEIEYEELFKFINKITKYFLDFYFYLTGSSIFFDNLEEQGKNYILHDLNKIKFHEELRKLYFKNVIQEISNEEIIEFVKKHFKYKSVVKNGVSSVNSF